MAVVRTLYSLSAFDAQAAAEGALCVMVTRGYEKPDIDNIGTDKVVNTDFKGTGICRFMKPDTYILTVNGATYRFGSNGKGIYTTPSARYELQMGSISSNEVESLGNVARSKARTVVSRSSSGELSTNVEYTDTDVTVNSLNARDEFAVQALRELMCHASDPSSMSDSEMDFYCKTAYRWAANMMNAAANARSTFEQEESSAITTEETPVSEDSLITTTERLLNNIVVSLQRTNIKETQDKTDIYSERVSVPDLIAFLNTYVKNGETTVGLKDLIDAIKGISVGDIDFTALVDAIKSGKSVTGTVSIGDSGLGNSSSNPLYIKDTNYSESNIKSIIKSVLSNTTVTVGETTYSLNIPD